MAALAEVLSRQVGRTVVDRSELSGLYDFDLQFASTSISAVEPAPGGAAPLVTALREQLGLGLESGSAPLDVLIIERIERPDEN